MKHLEHSLATKLNTHTVCLYGAETFQETKKQNQTIIYTYLVLVDSNDVGKEREELDLHGHKIDVELLVEAGGLAGD